MEQLTSCWCVLSLLLENNNMNRLIRHIGFWAMLLVVVSLSSCTKDAGADIGGDTETVRVRVSFKMSGMKRALTTENESTINNVMLFAFDSDGNLVDTAYFDMAAYEEVYFVTTVGVRQIYAIANISANLKNSLNSRKTLAQLSQLAVAITDPMEVVNANDAVMSGNTTQNITVLTKEISIPLKRLCAKLTIKLAPAFSSSGAKITGYRLCHVPQLCPLVEPTSDTPVRAYTSFAATTGLSVTDETTLTFYVYENLAGKNSAVTSETERTTANAPANATYLEIYVETDNLQSTYHYYLGGFNSSGTADVTNFNIYRNFNYTYNFTVYETGENDGHATRIGDYLFSDGTWGTLSANTGKTPVAIIFSNTTTDTDAALGFIHGYALGFKDLGETYWAYNIAYVGPHTTQISGADNILNDRNGYSNTLTLIEYDGDTNTKLGTAYKVRHYGDSDYAGVGVPPNTSGWFLPSSGQWCDIILNLGGLKGTTMTKATQNINWGSGSAAKFVNTIAVYFTNAGHDTDKFKNDGMRYWSSTESTSGPKWTYMPLIAGGNMQIINDDAKVAYVSRHTRAIIAF